MRNTFCFIGIIFILSLAVYALIPASVSADPSPAGLPPAAATDSPVTLVENGTFICAYKAFNLTGKYRHDAELTVSPKGFVTGHGSGTSALEGGAEPMLIDGSSEVELRVEGWLTTDTAESATQLFLKSRKCTDIKNKIVYKIQNFTITCLYDGKTGITECVPPMPDSTQRYHPGLSTSKDFEYPELNMPFKDGAQKTWEYTDADCVVYGTSTLVFKTD